jgi:hypothetical protein
MATDRHRSISAPLLIGLLMAFGLLCVNLPEKASADKSDVTPRGKNLVELETQAFDMQGCMPLYHPNNSYKMVIRDGQTFQAHIRNDMSREPCLKNLKPIDFDKYTLLGIELNSGWCRVPRGLTYKTLKDDAQKCYRFVVSYRLPVEPCRARSQYELWVLVPKLPPGYEVTFEVNDELQAK